jgi:signal recognition particle GTPase
MRTFIWATTTIISISTCLNVSTAFVRIPPSPWTKRARSKAELNMVFDFFKKRASEGVDQVTKLADAASKGKLGAGLREAAAYTSETNVAFASGLAKSRDRLLQNMELLLTGNSENLLKELQDILIQSDLGMKTSDDIVAEVKSLQAAGQRFTSREDLLSVMRGKLIEALDTGIPGTIQFSEDKLPTVLFIMGASKLQVHCALPIPFSLLTFLFQTVWEKLLQLEN